MRGFNPGAVIPKRNLADVKPMRFNLIVKIHPEKEEAVYIVMPDSVKRHRDSTRGWFGTVMAVGAAIPKMRQFFGRIKPGTVCLFDESVSIDDPNRCFDWGDDRFVMFDIDTVMGIQHPKGVTIGPEWPFTIQMLGDRVLARKAKKEDFSITKSKLWIPAGNEAQDLGAQVIEVGPGLWNADRQKHIPMDFKKGDFVLFSKYAGTDLKIAGHDHIVLRQDKILAIVNGEANRIKFN